MLVKSYNTASFFIRVAVYRKFLCRCRCEPIIENRPVVRRIFITFAKSTGLVSVTPSCVRDGKRNVLSFLFRSVDKSRETRSEPIWFSFRGSAWCSQTWCVNLKKRKTAANILVYTFRSFLCIRFVHFFVYVSFIFVYMFRSFSCHYEHNCAIDTKPKEDLQA
jgi:hypothetical protein